MGLLVVVMTVVHSRPKSWQAVADAAENIASPERSNSTTSSLLPIQTRAETQKTVERLGTSFAKTWMIVR